MHYPFIASMFFHESAEIFQDIGFLSSHDALDRRVLSNTLRIYETELSARLSEAGQWLKRVPYRPQDGASHSEKEQQDVLIYIHHLEVTLGIIRDGIQWSEKQLEGGLEANAYLRLRKLFQNNNVCPEPPEVFKNHGPIDALAKPTRGLVADVFNTMGAVAADVFRPVADLFRDSFEEAREKFYALYDLLFDLKDLQISNPKFYKDVKSAYGEFLACAGVFEKDIEKYESAQGKSKMTGAVLRNWRQFIELVGIYVQFTCTDTSKENGEEYEKALEELWPQFPKLLARVKKMLKKNPVHKKQKTNEISRFVTGSCILILLAFIARSSFPEKSVRFFAREAEKMTRPVPKKKKPVNVKRMKSVGTTIHQAAANVLKHSQIQQESDIDCPVGLHSPPSSSSAVDISGKQFFESSCAGSLESRRLARPDTLKTSLSPPEKEDGQDRDAFAYLSPETTGFFQTGVFSYTESGAFKRPKMRSKIWSSSKKRYSKGLLRMRIPFKKIVAGKVIPLAVHDNYGYLCDYQMRPYDKKGNRVPLSIAVNYYEDGNYAFQVDGKMEDIKDGENLEFVFKKSKRRVLRAKKEDQKFEIDSDIMDGRPTWYKEGVRALKEHKDDTREILRILQKIVQGQRDNPEWIYSQTGTISGILKGCKNAKERLKVLSDFCAFDCDVGTELLIMMLRMAGINSRLVIGFQNQDSPGALSLNEAHGKMEFIVKGRAYKFDWTQFAKRSSIDWKIENMVINKEGDEDEFEKMRKLEFRSLAVRSAVYTGFDRADRTYTDFEFNASACEQALTWSKQYPRIDEGIVYDISNAFTATIHGQLAKADLTDGSMSGREDWVFSSMQKIVTERKKSQENGKKQVSMQSRAYMLMMIKTLQFLLDKDTREDETIAFRKKVREYVSAQSDGLFGGSDLDMKECLRIVSGAMGRIKKKDGNFLLVEDEDGRKFYTAPQFSYQLPSKSEQLKCKSVELVLPDNNESCWIIVKKDTAVLRHYDQEKKIYEISFGEPRKEADLAPRISTRQHWPYQVPVQSYKGTVLYVDPTLKRLQALGHLEEDLPEFPVDHFWRIPIFSKGEKARKQWPIDHALVVAFKLPDGTLAIHSFHKEIKFPPIKAKEITRFDFFASEDGYGGAYFEIERMDGKKQIIGSEGIDVPNDIYEGKAEKSAFVVNGKTYHKPVLVTVIRDKNENYRCLTGNAKYVSVPDAQTIQQRIAHLSPPIDVLRPVWFDNIFVCKFAQEKDKKDGYGYVKDDVTIICGKPNENGSPYTRNADGSCWRPVFQKPISHDHWRYGGLGINGVTYSDNNLIFIHPDGKHEYKNLGSGAEVSFKKTLYWENFRKQSDVSFPTGIRYAPFRGKTAYVCQTMSSKHYDYDGLGKLVPRQVLVVGDRPMVTMETECLGNERWNNKYRYHYKIDDPQGLLPPNLQKDLAGYKAFCDIFPAWQGGSLFVLHTENGKGRLWDSARKRNLTIPGISDVTSVKLLAECLKESKQDINSPSLFLVKGLTKEGNSRCRFWSPDWFFCDQFPQEIFCDIESTRGCKPFYVCTKENGGKIFFSPFESDVNSLSYQSHAHERYTPEEDSHDFSNLVISDNNTLVVDNKKIILKQPLPSTKFQNISADQGGFYLQGARSVYVTREGDVYPLEGESTEELKSQDGYFLIAIRAEESIRIWSRKEKRILHEIPRLKKNEGESYSMRFLGKKDEYILVQGCTYWENSDWKVRAVKITSTLPGVADDFFEDIYEKTKLLPFELNFRNNQLYCCFGWNPELPLNLGSEAIIRALQLSKIRNTPELWVLAQAGLIAEDKLLDMLRINPSIVSLLPQLSKEIDGVIDQARIPYTELQSQSGPNEGINDVLHRKLEEYTGGVFSKDLNNCLRAAVPLNQSSLDIVDETILLHTHGHELITHLPAWYIVPDKEKLLTKARDLMNEKYGRIYPLPFAIEGKPRTLSQAVLRHQRFTEWPPESYQLNEDSRAEVRFWRQLDERLCKMYGAPEVEQTLELGSAEERMEVLRTALEKPADWYKIYLLTALMSFLGAAGAKQLVRKSFYEELQQFTQNIHAPKKNGIAYDKLLKTLETAAPGRMKAQVREIVSECRNLPESAQISAVMLGTLEPTNSTGVLKHLLTFLPTFANSISSAQDIWHMLKLKKALKKVNDLFGDETALPYTKVMKALLEQSFPDAGKQIVDLKSLRETFVRIERLYDVVSVNRTLSTMGSIRAPRHFLNESGDFQKHRPYVAGDDIRKMDWKVYGKSDKYYIKQRESEVSLPNVIELDVFDFAENFEEKISKLFALLLTIAKKREPYRIILSARGAKLLSVPEEVERGRKKLNPIEVINDIADIINCYFRSRKMKGEKEISRASFPLNFDPGFQKEKSVREGITESRVILFYSPTDELLASLGDKNNEVWVVR